MSTTIYDWATDVDTSRFGDGGSLNLRSDANGTLVGTIPNGAQVHCASADRNNEWIRCKYNGQMGYVMSKFIVGTAAYNAGNPTNGSGNYNPPNTVNCKATVRGSNVRLYTSPDTSSNSILVANGTSIYVSSQSVNGLPIMVWLRAAYNNKLYYVEHNKIEVHPALVHYGCCGCERYGEGLLQEGNTNCYQMKSDMYHLGWNNLALNSIFDAATEEAVKDFQRECGLQIDGIVGMDTKGKLYEWWTFG